MEGSKKLGEMSLLVTFNGTRELLTFANKQVEGFGMRLNEIARDKRMFFFFFKVHCQRMELHSEDGYFNNRYL